MHPELQALLNLERAPRAAQRQQAQALGVDALLAALPQVQRGRQAGLILRALGALCAQDPTLFPQVEPALGTALKHPDAAWRNHALAALREAGHAPAGQQAQDQRQQARDSLGVGCIAVDRPLSGLTVLLRCRSGFQGMLAKSLPGSWQVRIAGPGRVYCAPPTLGHLQCSPYWWDITVPLCHAPQEAGLEGLCQKFSRAPLEAWRALTQGPLRVRIDWEDAGHRRGATRQLAAALRQRWADCVDDPKQAQWDILLRHRDGQHQMVARPRLPEQRWPWRQQVLPASSHPAVASALVAWSEPQAQDVVFDPCCGAGSELILRALAGPAQGILGWDHSPVALEAAQHNARAADVAVAYQESDLQAPWPAGITSVICNPPLGRRVAPKEAQALGQVIQARVVEQGARLTWIRPPQWSLHPQLRTVRRQRLDLGGFMVILEALTAHTPRGR